MSLTRKPAPDLSAAAAARALGYRLGTRYHCNYWRRNHRIVAAGWRGTSGNGSPPSDTKLPWVQSLWEDGRRTTHSTRLDPHDKELPAPVGEASAPVLYAYRCSSCQNRGSVYLAGHAHHGALVPCSACGAATAVCWQGEPDAA